MLAVRSSIEFNQCVQVDLMFYVGAATQLGSDSSGIDAIRQHTVHIILRMVDECMRWSIAVDISGNSLGGTIDGIILSWCTPYGKPETMIWRGERAMASVDALQWASRNPLQFVQQAKHQKVWIVDRH